MRPGSRGAVTTRTLASASSGAGHVRRARSLRRSAMVRSRAVSSRTPSSTDADDPSAPRSRTLAAAVVGAAVATVIILASLGSDVRNGDGLIYRYVASHLSTPSADVHPIVRERGTSLRYGRIGLPITIWVVSAGKPAAMRFTQPIIMIAAAAAASAAAALLFPGAGPVAPILPFLAPGFPLSIAGGYAEALAVALALWAVVFALRRRWVFCGVMLSAAILTRENAAAVLVGLVAWMLWRRSNRAVPIVVASLVPVAAWYGFVKQRYGYFPPFDPYLRVTTDTVATPGIAIVHSFTDAASTRAGVTAALHLGAAVLAVLLVRRSLFALIATAASLQVLVSGPFAWRFVGEAARTAVFLQLFLALAIVAWRRPAWTDPRSLP